MLDHFVSCYLSILFVIILKWHFQNALFHFVFNFCIIIIVIVRGQQWICPCESKPQGSAPSAVWNEENPSLKKLPLYDYC